MFVMFKSEQFSEKFWKCRRRQTSLKEMNHIIILNFVDKVFRDERFNIVFNFNYNLAILFFLLLHFGFLLFYLNIILAQLSFNLQFFLLK